MDEPADCKNEIQKALINHNKVIITPHYGWYSESSERDLRKLAAENIADVFNGKLSRYIVNA
jgi:lactate dehydrogenase-like 2-hydroxyacid dehydrogenase